MLCDEGERGGRSLLFSAGVDDTCALSSARGLDVSFLDNEAKEPRPIDMSKSTTSSIGGGLLELIQSRALAIS